MIAVFTFKLSDLIVGTEKAGDQWQWQWYGQCKAETEGEPLSFGAGPLSIPLNRLDNQLTVRNISGLRGILRTYHVVANFREQAVELELEQELSTAESDGTADAMIMSYHAATKEYGQQFLGITIGLRSQKYELFRTFITLHFGRPDLIGRITSSFDGFAYSSQPGLRIPTESQFLKGRPYLVLGDFSLVFSAKPLP
jgi:hypothetical protein